MIPGKKGTFFFNSQPQLFQCNNSGCIERLIRSRGVKEEGHYPDSRMGVEVPERIFCWISQSNGGTM